MRPVTLKLSSFLSYRGEHPAINFDGVTLAVLSGFNGAGKSSIVDAMRFALFGHTRVARDLSSIITRGEQLGQVEMVFSVGTDTCLVSRQVKRGRGCTYLHFEVNGQSQDGKTIPETQKRIEQYLRMTDALFITTACANQKNAAAFSEAKPADRKQVLVDILDLGIWERRAEIARQWARDLAARTESDHKRHEALQAASSGADGLRQQIAEIDATQGDLARQVAQVEAELAQEQQTKEEMVRDREADRARRNELEDLSARATRMQAGIEEAKARISELEKAITGKAAVLDQIRRAEEAQTYSQELEAKRQEAERLDGDLRLIRQEIEAAEKSHAAEIKRLEQSVAAGHDKHQAAVDALTERIAKLNQQAETLDRVPCVQRKDEALAEDCPLLTLARGAKASLPGMEQQRAEVVAAAPWSDADHELAGLRSRLPAAEQKARLAALNTARKAIAYDPKEHADAKRRAGRLQELQGELGRVERAEAQKQELLRTLEPRTVEAGEIAGQVSALQTELGAARNWDALLAQAERSISAGKQKVHDLQERVQSLQAQRGGFAERLRAAEEATIQAEQLAAEVAEAERRLKVLKILAQAFGKQGIRALLIEKAVPDLEAIANDVLSTLTDGRLSLRLESQRPTQSKTLEETLNIRITDEHGEGAYESFSGGEAMRVDLALRIALSMLLASRAGARCELLVLDETAAPLDVPGRALFVDCLQRIADRFAMILVITHVEDMKDLFPFRFEISKTAEGSRVEMVAA